VTDVVWFDSDDFRSVSDRHAFGAIFIAPAPHWTDVHHLETIVHEAGHLGLLVKQGFDPLVENPTERASSPLRADRRPLSAILHAAFVLVRMAHAHARYLDHASADRKDVAARLFARRRGELAQSLDALRSHARFTARGGELFESIERGARELGARP
jgi:HEXXH motif-containing protein